MLVTLKNVAIVDVRSGQSQTGKTYYLVKLMNDDFAQLTLFANDEAVKAVRNNFAPGVRANVILDIYEGRRGVGVNIVGLELVA